MKLAVKLKEAMQRVKENPGMAKRAQKELVEEHRERIQTANEKLQEQGRARLQDNAEYQRRCSMTREEKARSAKDQLSKNIHEHCKQMGLSSREAERRVEATVERYVREVEQK